MDPAIDAALRERVSPHWPLAYCGRTVDGHPLQLARLGQVQPKQVLSAVSEDEFRTQYLNFVPSEQVLGVEVYEAPATPCTASGARRPESAK